jgi:hypothetical protein
MKQKPEPRRVSFFMQIDEDLKVKLQEYSAKTGRSYQFVVEHGIQVAIDTDCRNGGELPMNKIFVFHGPGRGEYIVPEPVALAWQEIVQHDDDLKMEKKALERAALNEQSH